MNYTKYIVVSASGAVFTGYAYTRGLMEPTFSDWNQGQGSLVWFTTEDEASEVATELQTKLKQPHEVKCIILVEEIAKTTGKQSCN